MGAAYITWPPHLGADSCPLVLDSCPSGFYWTIYIYIYILSKTLTQFFRAYFTPGLYLTGHPTGHRGQLSS